MRPPLGLIGCLPPISIQPLLDRLPALAGLGDAEVVDGHVLARREAVVRLDAVDAVDVGDARAPPGVGDRACARAAARTGCPCSRRPCRRTCRRDVWWPQPLMRGIDSSVMPRALRVLLGVGARGEEHGDRAVGDLRAVRDADAPADGRVELVARAGVRLVHVPGARLRERVQLRVRVVDRRDAGEVLVLQAVALVVLVAELAEELRKRELDALGLLLVPGRGAEVVAALGRGHGLHLLDADDARQVVPARLDLGERRQERDAPGRARRLVPARWAGR